MSGYLLCFRVWANGFRKLLWSFSGHHCGITGFWLGVSQGVITHRPLSSYFLGLPYRILNMNHKKELFRCL